MSLAHWITFIYYVHSYISECMCFVFKDKISVYFPKLNKKHKSLAFKTGIFWVCIQPTHRQKTMAVAFTSSKFIFFASWRRIDVQIGNTLNAPCTGKVQKPQDFLKRKRYANDSDFDQMGVSKNRGTPKWMVYNGWFGGTTIFGNIQMNKRSWKWWEAHEFAGISIKTGLIFRFRYAAVSVSM